MHFVAHLLIRSTRVNTRVPYGFFLILFYTIYCGQYSLKMILKYFKMMCNDISHDIEKIASYISVMLAVSVSK